MPLELDFTVIPDPDGFRRTLRLKGDWIVVKVSDGTLTGLGEASHSGDDAVCRRRIAFLFGKYVQDMPLDLEHIRALEAGRFAKTGKLATATAMSSLNQALYDLLAQREGVPVWRLFRDEPMRRSVPLYVTINRCLTTRTVEEYKAVVANVAEHGFTVYKCAPFDHVTPDGDQVAQSRIGLAILQSLRNQFPEVGLRIDFHGRFEPRAFAQILPEIEALTPDWIEEPTPIGRVYLMIRRKIDVKLAAGELYFGVAGFRPVIENQLVDVIMPDVKHVGGLGPMLGVCELADQHGVEVSPHNPSGPISTMASLHAAALSARITSIEYSFDRDGHRKRFGEPIENGQIHLTDAPGWGIDRSQY